MTSIFGKITALACCGVLAWACGSTQPSTEIDKVARTGNVQSAVMAYERHRTLHGPSIVELAKVAGVVLEQESLAGGSRGADAFSQLTLAGNAARDVLVRLSARDDPKAALSRVKALLLLGRLGEDGSESTLRTFLDHRDPEVRAVALEALSLESELEQLLGAARDQNGAIREAAVGRLAMVEAHPKVLHVLVDAAQRDPLSVVRAKAMASLKPYGARASAAVTPGLRDPHLPVRLQSMELAASSGDPKLMQLLAEYLKQEPHPESLEAARQLAKQEHDPAQRKQGKTYLVRAIASEDAKVRHQAIIGITTVKADDKATEHLGAAWKKETEPSIQVILADALVHVPEHRDSLIATLKTIAQGDGLPAVHAALLLARLNENDIAIERIKVLMQDGSIEARAEAARGLARDLNRTDDARAALQAPHPRVRIAAAGGILVAALHESN